ncbi:MAG TPA: VCBS repeat-containing protein, partial [Blastocatellia bacterium]|nr:VCBS repeat-containing protein [Blastocatellia bacterium]
MKKKLLSRARFLSGLLCVGFVLLLQFSHRAGASGSAPRSNPSQRAARLSGHITVQAAGRGNPWINLSDGRDLELDYTGSASVAHELERNQAEPLSLASADFDEDGVPDLLCGYVTSSGGILTLRRGNLDSIYPNSPEAQQRRREALGEESLSSGEYAPTPFLADVRVFEAADAPQFMGTGDFDNDGHLDVVFATAGSSAIDFLHGDGQGNLGRSETIRLPGRVTAMTTGDINRRDGLEDVVVGIVGVDGPQVLIFEGPDGVLKATPEAIPLPVEATALAIGQLDDSYEIDLAIAAGHELLIAHGRD